MQNSFVSETMLTLFVISDRHDFVLNHHPIPNVAIELNLSLIETGPASKERSPRFINLDEIKNSLLAYQNEEGHEIDVLVWDVVINTQSYFDYFLEALGHHFPLLNFLIRLPKVPDFEVESKQANVFFYDGQASLIAIRSQLQLLLSDKKKLAKLKVFQKNYRAFQTLYEQKAEVLESAVGVMTLEASGRVYSANDYVLKLLSQPLWAVLNRPLNDLFKMNLSDLKETAQEVRFFKGNGRFGWVEMYRAVLQKQPGVEVILLRDISAFKAREKMEDFQHYQDGLLRAKKELKHNVGNTLNSMVATADVLSDSVQNFEKMAHYIARFLSQNTNDSSRALAFLQQVNQTYSVEAFKEAVSFSNTLEMDIKELVTFFDKGAEVGVSSSDQAFLMVDLSELLDGLMSSMSAFLSVKEVSIRLVESPQVILLKVPSNELFHALLNLIKNAVEALTESQSGIDAEHKMITVATRVLDEGGVNLEVHDTAGGLSEALFKVVFEKGFTTKSTGTGEGLHSVANFMRFHDGEVSVSSNPKSGTLFCLKFPASKAVIST